MSSRGGFSQSGRIPHSNAVSTTSLQRPSFFRQLSKAGDIPTPEQKALITSLLSDARGHLAEVKKHLRINDIPKLRKRHLVLATFIFECKALLHPLRTLPAELVGRIFEIYCETERQWPLLLICRRWRHIAITNSVLWTKVRVPLVRRRSMAAGLRTQLDRSAGQLLDVYFTYGALALRSPDTMNILLASKSRWRSIHCDASPAMKLKDMPALEHLDVRINVPASLRQDMQLKAPNLRSVVFNTNSVYNDTTVPWAQLQSCVLVNRAVSNVRQLRDVRVLNCTSIGNGGRPSRWITFKPDNIRLPCLKRLEFSRDNYEKMAELLCAPALTTLVTDRPYIFKAALSVQKVGIDGVADITGYLQWLRFFNSIVHVKTLYVSLPGAVVWLLLATRSASQRALRDSMPELNTLRIPSDTVYTHLQGILTLLSRRTGVLSTLEVVNTRADWRAGIPLRFAAELEEGCEKYGVRICGMSVRENDLRMLAQERMVTDRKQCDGTCEWD